MFHRLCDRLQRNEDVYPLPSRAGDGPGHGMLLIGPQLPVKQEEEMDQQPDGSFKKFSSSSGGR